MKIYFSRPHIANGPPVQRINADLEGPGHEVCLDANQIKSGDESRSAIARGIPESQQVLRTL